MWPKSWKDWKSGTLRAASEQWRGPLPLVSGEEDSSKFIANCFFGPLTKWEKEKESLAAICNVVAAFLFRPPVDST